MVGHRGLVRISRGTNQGFNYSSLLFCSQCIGQRLHLQCTNEESNQKAEGRAVAAMMPFESCVRERVRSGVRDGRVQQEAET